MSARARATARSTLRIDGSWVSCSMISSNLLMCSEPDSILTQWSIGVEMIEWDPLRAKTLDQQSSKLEIRVRTATRTMAIHAPRCSRNLVEQCAGSRGNATS